MKLERLLQGLIAVLTAALIFVVYDSVRERNVVVGDTAPGFKIVTDNGRTMTRSDFCGKILVLNFWATWCPPCLEELPSLNAFHKRMAASGVVVLGVSVDKNDQQYKAFLKRNGVAFETGRDPDANTPADYGTFKYPETYIISPDGKVIEKVISNRNWVNDPIYERLKGLLSR